MERLSQTMRKVSVAFANCRTECPLSEKWSLVPQPPYDARQRAEVLPQGGGQGVEGWKQSDDLG